MAFRKFAVLFSHHFWQRTGLLILFGAWLAFQNRHVLLTEFNDSFEIGLSIYSVTLMSIIIVPIAAMLDGTNTSTAFTLRGIMVVGVTTVSGRREGGGFIYFSPIKLFWHDFEFLFVNLL